MMSADDKKITIELTHAEALVLFEWVTRTDTDGTLPLEHEAEELVLWSIQGQLENILAEPFDARYKDLVATARDRVQKLAHGEKAP